ncbi:Serine/threonine-protein kinase [Saitozyma podzolica]|uniref:Serine/threonine-protein kinase ATG1 n=1 Tax=Saitozyma podzolica TaxID=1890683 RepID=A0A427YQ01_9TREE|nr:Serine/threonine-protein kinase [Saitozyma podzolica]
MPPDAARPSSGSGHRKEGSHKERIGNYVVGAEIGRGSFATVYKGYRSRTREPVAIKAVSRQKLTTKLLENLESEINILKAISHRNIVSLEDCFKNDTHIYLVMEYCTGSDLSIYIKNRGKLPTLDFVPRPGMALSGSYPSEGDKVFWPHPPTGGLDERVTRCFLGQLAQALRFLRSQNLIHRDIKPQNLLLQPATSAEIADGHPYGIPVLKVADFGFARILPAAAMAETLCGSPLYMAPEILRYEKYDAKADLWSVGAVLYEMAAGKPPFRANNHVELLRKIEKSEDRIKFPDESRHSEGGDDKEQSSVVPVSPDIKALIRRLLRRRPTERMGFEEFFACGVWDGHMTESSDGSLSLDVSTDSSAVLGSRLREMVESAEKAREKERLVPTHAPQPLATDPALNPQPAPRPSSAVTTRNAATAMISPQAVQAARPLVRRSEPKYYVSDNSPAPETPSTIPSTSTATPAPLSTQTQMQVQTPGPAPSISSRTGPPPQPISTADRRLSAPSSVEDPAPITPNAGQSGLPRPRVSEGSPLAATPPITSAAIAVETGKNASALDASDSVVGREYVVVEKQNVEVNALADELDQASRINNALVRRPSSRTSVVSRPVSAFKPTGPGQGVPGSSPTTERAPAFPSGGAPMSYSPPFALSTTPPFAFTPSTRQTPAPVSRPPSVTTQLNLFPPSIPGFSPEGAHRFGTSPSSLQTGALARALTTQAFRFIGTSANTAATALVRAASKRRPTIIRSGEIDPAEDEVLRSVEDLARKAFVLFEYGDAKLLLWEQFAATRSSANPSSAGTGAGAGAGTTPPFAAGSSGPGRRKSSSSSINSEIQVLRQQEAAAGAAMVLYYKAMAFIFQGTIRVQRYWESKGQEYQTSTELNEMMQWLRARFNEVCEKVEWAKQHCAEDLPWVDKLVHDRARDLGRQAACAELRGEYPVAEQGYENAIWLLQSLLDEVMYETGVVPEDEKASVEKVIVPIRNRLEALRKKIGTTEAK